MGAVYLHCADCGYYGSRFRLGIRECPDCGSGNCTKDQDEDYSDSADFTESHAMEDLREDETSF